MTTTRLVIGLFAIIAVMLITVAGYSETKMYEVYGTLSYPDGKPAPGILIHVGGWNMQSTEVITDANGKYKTSVDGLRSVFYTETGDFALYYEFSIPEGSLPSIQKDLKLKSTSLVLGEITDVDTGEPVMDAEVFISGGYGARVKSGSDGVFKAKVLAQSDMEMDIRKPGYVVKRIRFSALDTNATAWRIQITQGGVIRGKVVDKHGNPLVGIYLRSEGEVGASTHTSYDGHYELREVDPTKPVQIIIDDPNIQRRETFTFEFPKGSRQTTGDMVVDPKVNELREIAGKVTDEKGNPVTGAQVHYGQGSFRSNKKDTQTDDQGNYSFTGMGIAKEMLMVQADGFAPAFMPIGEKGDQRIDVKLQKAHSAQVHVINASGKPLEGVLITVNARTPVLGQLCSYEVEGFDIYRWLYTTSTDQNGNAALTNLPAGDVLVGLVKQDYTSPDNIPIHVDSSDNLIKMQGTPQIAGTVVDADTGIPIHSFTVKWAKPRSSSIFYNDNMTFDHPEGKFSVQIDNTDSIEPLRSTIRVLADGYISEEKTITATRAPVIDYANVFELQKTRAVKGRIVDTAGRGIVDAQVTVLEDRDLQNANNPTWLASHPDLQVFTTAPDGSFTINPVTMRSGTLIVKRQGYSRTARSNINLTKPVQIVLPAAASLTVKAARMVNNDATVGLLSLADGTGDSKPLLTDGIVTLPEVLPGKYTVYAGYAVTVWNRIAYDINLAPGQSVNLDLDKKRNVRARLIFTRNGVPVANARVEIQCEDGSSAMLATSDSQGECRIGLEKAGPAIMTYHEMQGDQWVGSRYRTISVNLKPGDNTINIKLPSGRLSGRLVDAKTLQPIQGELLRSFTQGKPPLSLQFDKPYKNPGFTEWYGARSTTAKDGTFTINDLPYGQITLTSDFHPMGETFISAPITFNEKTQTRTVLLKMYDPGRLRIQLVDAKSGAALKPMPMVLYTTSRALVNTNSNYSNPTGLPPGKYVLWIRPDDGRHLPANANIEIKSGKTLNITIKLIPASQRIVFKVAKGGRFDELSWPDKPARDNVNSSIHPWIGFTLYNSATGKTVLTGPNGPEWGGCLTTFDNNRTTALLIAPGKYVLVAVLRNIEIYSVKPYANLWRIKQKITVSKGTDTVITIK